MRPEDPLTPVKCRKTGVDCFWMRRDRDYIMVRADSIEKPDAKAGEDVKGNARDARGYRQFDAGAGHVFHDPSAEQ